MASLLPLLWRQASNLGMGPADQDGRAQGSHWEQSLTSCQAALLTCILSCAPCNSL